MVENGIRVTNAHVNSVPIAEFVLRAAARQNSRVPPGGETRPRERRWQIHDWREVSGTTWLIIGLGGIGSEVAHRARAFGATVIGCRRHPSSGDPADRTVTPDRLDQVIGLADVIVLAAPAAPETDEPRGRRLPQPGQARQPAGQRGPGDTRGRERPHSRVWTPDACPLRWWTSSGPSRFRPTTRSGHIRPSVSPPRARPAVSAGSAGRPTCSKRISIVICTAVRCATR